MYLSDKIKKAMEGHPAIVSALKGKSKEVNWSRFTRTQFNLIARVINKQVSREAMENTDLVEMHLIIGKQQLEKQLFSRQFQQVYDFVRWLGNLREYQVFNWISGKTLQSYWHGGEAKYIKINVLLVFLQVAFADWDAGLQERGRQGEEYGYSLSKVPVSGGILGGGKTALGIIKA